LVSREKTGFDVFCGLTIKFGGKEERLGRSHGPEFKSSSALIS
jgi:hypothetical protein